MMNRAGMSDNVRVRGGATAIDRLNITRRTLDANSRSAQRIVRKPVHKPTVQTLIPGASYRLAVRSNTASVKVNIQKEKPIACGIKNNLPCVLCIDHIYCIDVLDLIAAYVIHCFIATDVWRFISCVIMTKIMIIPLVAVYLMSTKTVRSRRLAYTLHNVSEHVDCIQLFFYLLKIIVLKI